MVCVVNKVHIFLKVHILVTPLVPEINILIWIKTQRDAHKMPI